MSQRFAYPGSPENYNGSDLGTNIVPGSEALASSYAAQSKEVKKAAASSSPEPSSNESQEKKEYPLGAAAQVIIGIVIIAVILGIVFLRGVLFGNDDDSAASADSVRPTTALLETAPADPPVVEATTAAEQETADSGSREEAQALGVTAGGGAFANSIKDAGEMQQIPDSELPAQVAEVAEFCVVSPFAPFFMSTKVSATSEISGINCGPVGSANSSITSIVYTDAPVAIDISRDGMPTVETLDLGLTSNRGSDIRVQHVSGSAIVTEVLPGDEGVFNYIIDFDEESDIVDAMESLEIVS